MGAVDNIPHYLLSLSLSLSVTHTHTHTHTHTYSLTHTHARARARISNGEVSSDYFDAVAFQHMRYVNCKLYIVILL